MSERTDEWINEWMDGWIVEWMNGWINEWNCSQIDERTKRKFKEWKLQIFLNRFRRIISTTQTPTFFSFVLILFQRCPHKCSSMFIFLGCLSWHCKIGQENSLKQRRNPLKQLELILFRNIQIIKIEKRRRRGKTWLVNEEMKKLKKFWWGISGIFNPYRKFWNYLNPVEYESLDDIATMISKAK